MTKVGLEKPQVKTANGGPKEMCFSHFGLMGLGNDPRPLGPAHFNP